ncbi:hypothetical protein JKF63_00635 [Porcisia hertigi]|uniref:C3H1-type domain-containing protein n=1 Tax=Porcisia hertigi TaxID=2761500 RepID=A0A836HTW6_9TRYP|nr:hypothetical protein JKF63_00635 [Porcisia hertigi]
MGRNKPRSKAVDVTKSLLQKTSITDHIAVQIAPNTVIQVAEDEFSPTQGSEAAFALRREGKLDASLKLCLNWRQGNCYNHTACTFAHVIPYFGASSDGGGTPGTPGKLGGLGMGFGGDTTYSSAAAGGEVGGRSSNSVSNTPWPQRVALPAHPAAATVSQRVEEGRVALAAVSVQHSAVSTITATPEVAEPTDAVEVALVTLPSKASSPSAVVSSDGLRTILLSLTATLANKAVKGSTTDATKAFDANANGGYCTPPHSAWLLKKAEDAEGEEGVTLAEDAYSWNQPRAVSMEDFVAAAGRKLLGEPLCEDGSAAELHYLLSHHANAATVMAMRRQQGTSLFQEQEESATRATAAGPRVFSTAPTLTVSSGVSPGVAQPTLIDLLLEAGGINMVDDDMPVPSLP